MVVNAEELKSRIRHLIDAAEAVKGRIDCHLSADEFEEIGYLTMRMAALEESISVFCEALLTRPELAGFLPYRRSVLTKQLKEKLELLVMLITATGMLYDIDRELLEKSIAAVGEVGEDRNAIVHGSLCHAQDGTVTFHIRNRCVPAGVIGFRTLSDRCQEATIDLLTSFSTFYGALIGKKSIYGEPEAALQVMAV